MNAGIYLGPRKNVWRRARALLLAFAAIPTLFHGVERYVRRQEVATLRGELATMEEELSRTLSSTALSESRAVMWQLRAISESGVAGAIPVTELLKLLERTLPDGVALMGVSIDPIPPRASLTIEARAARAADVTELQKNVASSPRVAVTQLLEERRAPDGLLTIRLRVDLIGGRP
ncbi:MAG: hypothetical protein E2P02_14460 [Acidobacteria bacterium]|nr:MAG: hypothetical protein E2P02_14460 [Acidobacteriota bacterium]